MPQQAIISEAENILGNFYGEYVEIKESHKPDDNQHSLQLLTNRKSYFLKYQSLEDFPDIFDKDAAGLQLLGETGAIHTPFVFGTGKTKSHCFIIMEYVNPAKTTENFWPYFAEKVAQLHKNSHDLYGLDYDNYIDNVQQYNNFHENWYDFFILERLEPQVHKARNHNQINKGHVYKLENLYKQLINLIPEERPALVHGNLNSSNYLVNREGKPILINPAVAYNHRETDIAVSRLFKSFDPSFYTHYNRVFPMEKGWEERLDIYNLYPLLVQINKTGMRYLSQMEKIINDF